MSLQPSDVLKFSQDQRDAFMQDLIKLYDVAQSTSTKITPSQAVVNLTEPLCSLASGIFDLQDNLNEMSTSCNSDIQVLDGRIIGLEQSIKDLTDSIKSILTSNQALSNLHGFCEALSFASSSLKNALPQQKIQIKPDLNISKLDKFLPTDILCTSNHTCNIMRTVSEI